jgi:hypothetical protein
MAGFSKMGNSSDRNHANPGMLREARRNQTVAKKK